MNRSGQPTPTEGVRNGLAGLLHDVTTLAELQFKLLSVDAKEASGRAVLPFALLGAAVVFSLSALPLLLIALAQLLRDQAGWPPALATLTAVVIGLIVAGVFAAIGCVRLRNCLAPLARSRDEFNRNVTWLKTALKRQDGSRRADIGLPPNPAEPLPPNYPR